MKTLKTLAACGAIAIAASFTANVYAQAAMDKGSMPGMNMPGMKMDQMTSSEMTEGEVRKIDKENKKITLKHGEIKNLDMPGMTMVFQVKDPTMLDKVQVGSKVRFKAEKADGAIVVTDVEVIK